MKKAAPETFSITNHTKAKLPRLAFCDMKDAVLGKKYILDVAVVSESEIKRLNKHYRDIDKATDILSFPLSKTEGEIYVNLAQARKECKKFDRPYENFIGFLFIHGLVHLKGFDHGSTMDRMEARFQKKFGFSHPTSHLHGPINNHRNRHRNIPRQSGDRASRR